MSLVMLIHLTVQVKTRQSCVPKLCGFRTIRSETRDVRQDLREMHPRSQNHRRGQSNYLEIISHFWHTGPFHVPGSMFCNFKEAV